MKRAPVDLLRKAIEAAQVLKNTGVLFVPMPVLSQEDHEKLTSEMLARLTKLEEDEE